ncbi:MAG: SusC/RagA family TonB-linked outer membrane protein, partial [Bacteroidales bacterium]|nr:SusC/RagA family TonB-linked outer membrane protein [Bacteroidales bacterium]
MLKQLLNKTALLLFVILSAVAEISAQPLQVRGTVNDSKGEPMVGVTILQKGVNNNGVISDADGRYSIMLKGDGHILSFVCIGYKTKDIDVKGRSVVNAVMEETSIQLEGLVVTALGITRKQKSLGYAVTKVNNKDLTAVVSNNWLDGMSGKVAGLTMNQAGSGPISSMRITLRGDQSLNYGSNQALFVVDGIPISSGSTATTSNSTYANGDSPVDFGNAASDINPEDVASVTVLKGPAATALYGSRAANGAIVITTKKGRAEKGLGITVNSSIVFDKAGYWPDFQTEYGSGSDMGLTPFCFWNLNASQTEDGIATTRHYSRYAFGEKFSKNTYRYQYNSKNWETGTFTKTPWEYKKDWYTGLFRTGVTYNNSVTIDGSNGKGTSTRMSIADMRNNWILPNTGYNKQTVSLSYNTVLNKYIKAIVKANYYHKQSDNIPVSGYDEHSPIYDITWGFNNNSINEWKDEYFLGRYNKLNYESQGEDGYSLVYPSGSSYNPYVALYEELNTMNMNRFIGSGSLNMKLNRNLTLDLRTGIDMNNEFRTQRKPFRTSDYPQGMYREQTLRTYEYNSDFLLRYTNNKWVNDHLNFTAAFGGNNMQHEYYRTQLSLYKLNVENVYNLSNCPSGTNPNPYNYRSKKIINSFYGFLSASWDDTYFLDITGRNDWSSTLSSGNWSFFYPSISGTVLVNNLFGLKESAPWMDMLKVRLSWANVGNDTSPYSTTDAYSTTGYYGGFKLPSDISNYYIKPENVESWELGLESVFFKNRLGFDLALYKSSTTNQIISAAVDQISGATSMKINAGEIENKGIELSMHIVPIRHKDIELSIDANWSKNWNKLVSLQAGWDPNQPLQTDMGTTIGGRIYIYSYVGHAMNVIYGRGYKRAPKGSYYLNEEGNKVDCSGMKIINSEGYPELDANPDRNLGKVNPDWKA